MYLAPREDLNAPDMYIPLMSFVTYILLSALLYGLSGTFHPELLGYTASTALGIVLCELVGLKLGCYLLNISNSQLLDLMAYSGYKFVGIIVSIAATAVLGRGLVAWAVFAYCYATNAFFLVSSPGKWVVAVMIARERERERADLNSHYSYAASSMCSYQIRPPMEMSTRQHRAPRSSVAPGSSLATVTLSSSSSCSPSPRASATDFSLCFCRVFFIVSVLVATPYVLG